MKKNKRILFLPKWYPNRIVPANGNFVENHAAAIGKFADIGVLFVRSEDRSPGKKYDVDVQEEHGFPVVRVYFKKPPEWLKFLTAYRYWTAQRIGYRKIEGLMGKPDIVHVHVLARSGLFALYLNRWKGIPYLITEHWSGYTRESALYRGIFRKWITRLLVKSAKKITVVSDYLKNAMLDHGLQGDYVIIPNVADINTFVPKTETRFQKNQTVRHLVHISTLDTRVKNIPGILHTIEKLGHLRQDFHLHLLGDGPDKAAQVALAKQLGILDKLVTFHGEVPPQKVAEMLSEACCLVLFSNYETQSVVMIEAFCCGIPVIATKAGGIPEHLDQSRGMLLVPKNELSLEHSMAEMLERFKLYDPVKIREYAVKHFSQDTIGKQFAELYANIGN